MDYAWMVICAIGGGLWQCPEQITPRSHPYVCYADDKAVISAQMTLAHSYWDKSSASWKRFQYRSNVPCDQERIK